MYQERNTTEKKTRDVYYKIFFLNLIDFKCKIIIRITVGGFNCGELNLILILNNYMVM